MSPLRIALAVAASLFALVGIAATVVGGGIATIILGGAFVFGSVQMEEPTAPPPYVDDNRY